MRFNLILLIIFPLFIAGVIALQIFLSKRESKWPGLILPAISLGISLLAVLSVAVFSLSQPGPSELIVQKDGQVIERHVQSGTERQAAVGAPEIIATIAIVFLLYNIPTIILLAIYAACRERYKKKRELEKMNIQDLY